MAELNNLQKQAAKLLASGVPKTQICEQLGIKNRRTIYNWLQKPNFRKEVAANEKKIEEIQELDMIKAASSKAGELIEVELLYKQLLYMSQYAKNESVRYNATTYLLDRKLGKCKVQTEEPYQDKDDNDRDIEDLLKEIEGR